MKTTQEDLLGAVNAIREAATTPRSIMDLREWLRLHGYEEITNVIYSPTNTRKTSLLQQKTLVEELRNRYTSVEFATHILRHWLVAYKYETSLECDHVLIVRETGRCHACGECLHMVTRSYHTKEHSAVCVHCDLVID